MAEKKRTRSPNFPAIALKKSIDYTKKLLDKYSRHAAPAESAMNVLGYTAKSSVGLQAIAALSYYGLINIQGVKKEKKVSITDLAFKILMDIRSESRERDVAIQKTALKPTMFRNIWEKYQDSIPDDDVLHHELVFQYNFNPDSVRTFIRVFRRTMDFAKVYELGIMDEETKIAEEPKVITQADKPVIEQTISTKSISSEVSVGLDANLEKEIANYPVGKGVSIRLIATGPVTQKAIEKLAKLLEINKDDFPEDIPEPKVNVNEPSED